MNVKIVILLGSLSATAALAVTEGAAAAQTHATPAQTHATPAQTHATAAQTHAAAGQTHATAAQTHAAAGQTHATAVQTHATAAQTHATAGQTHATAAQTHANYTPSANSAHVDFEEESFYDSYIKGRLHIGASFTKSTAKETTAPAGTTYLGNLDDLREEDMTGIGFNIQYDLCDYIALSFANDMHVEHAVWNKPTIAHPYESTDGNLILDGMLYQVILQYPFRFYDNSWALTPYVGFGITEISAKWEYADWWHYGWSSPADYAYYGNGSTAAHKGYTRWMVLEEPSSAFTFTAGLSLQILAHLDLDFFYRQISVDDIDAKFHRRKPTGPIEREGHFPAEFSTLGLALRLVF